MDAEGGQAVADEEYQRHRAAIGKAFRLTRLRKELPMAEIGDQIGIGSPGLSLLERGLRDSQIGTYLHVSDLLGVSLIEMLEFAKPFLAGDAALEEELARRDAAMRRKEHLLHGKKAAAKKKTRNKKT